jgi:hypothetical protein
MAVQTRRELLERIKELEQENEDLQSWLEEIGDLASRCDVGANDSSNAG